MYFYKHNLSHCPFLILFFLSLLLYHCCCCCCMGNCYSALIYSVTVLGKQTEPQTNKYPPPHTHTNTVTITNKKLTVIKIICTSITLAKFVSRTNFVWLIRSNWVSLKACERLPSSVHLHNSNDCFTHLHSVYLSIGYFFRHTVSVLHKLVKY